MYNRYISLNEASAYESLYSNEDIIEKLGEVDIYDYEKGSFEWFKELSKRYFGGGYFYHYEADGITRQQLKEAQEQGFIKYSYYSNWQARQLNQTEYWCLTNKGLKALYKAYQGQW